MTRWLIDGNNVMGSRPDGWWNDRVGAMGRLAQQVAEWCWTHDDDVVLIFDGREEGSVSELAGGNLTIRFAGKAGRDAADDVVASLASPGDRVVTADRGLRRRLPASALTVGPRAFLDQLDR